jgi:predicted CXXCH cytochrome family protein
MRYQRADLNRTYEISQTIGSRFYQYYVGRGIEGPEPEEHAYYREEFVLPFGYWLSRSTWVPIVHVSSESHEKERWDSLEHLKPKNLAAVGTEGVGVGRGVIDHSVDIALNYARACNYCHTTFAMGEMLNRMPDQIGKSLRQPMFLEQSTYLAQNHPTLWDGSRATDSLSFDDLRTMSGKLVALDAPNHAAALGINCEACHLGCKQHTVQKEELPAFGPKHPSLFVHSNDATYTTAKNADNLNAICARCHTGDRPTYAAGMATWNSTEWTDAKRGSCYSQLTCVKCHNPHQAIGEQWTRSPKKDDDICLSCHQQYASADARQRHTHHRADSEGDRCMNCHMPKINEGIQDVVRTHTIFSPTNEKMLQANQPNACNLCHLDKPTRWATENLNQWYKTNISVSRSSGNATQLTQPAGLEWLTSSHDATRLVTSAAFAREGAKWGLPNLVPLLDDPILTNRQFAQQSIERLTNQDLNKEYGYWFYMTPEERKPLIDRIKQSLNRNP